eukprot:TRINITY_DN26440_c0_g1_i1.p2 TRINITY_DN26440_c0_g1~~TRINITY_DN26440_c0_g1_i1.p2  ORF type:complete len:274 (+),score=64.55 TRINITY_DN26440_c0_g1_i1:85-906(+)
MPARAAMEESREDEGEDDESSDMFERVHAEIERLLGMSFEEALNENVALRAYLERSEDPHELRLEFERSWDPHDAPLELRRVLAELLDPAIAAAEAAATEAFLRDPASYAADPGSDPASRAALGPQDRAEVESRWAATAPLGALELEEGAGTGIAAELPRRGGAVAEAQSDEVAADAGEGAAVEADERVNALLSMTFEEACDKCGPLRRYIAENGDDPAELAAEFRAHWGPEAPAELRHVLSDLVLQEDPDSGAPAAGAAGAASDPCRARSRL